MTRSTDPQAATADRYRHFAEVEARGLSASYEEWARGVADDPTVVALIDRLPAPKRQPNLVFSSARFLGAPITRYGPFARWLGEHWTAVEAVALTHATQTNEAGRCAVLLPALAALSAVNGDGPLALIEVGASAGLGLHPDRYSYRYRSVTGERMLHPAAGPSVVLLECALSGPVPKPRRLPEIVWRAGIDLNPLSVSRPADVDWLDALIWPEHEDRRATLRAAVEVARRHPVELVRGDLNARIAELVARARAEVPAGTTIVVFHTAVLVYLDPAAIEHFSAQMKRLPVRWLATEAPGVVPGVLEKLTQIPRASSDFILTLDGAPLAIAQPHGRALHWLS